MPFFYTPFLLLFSIQHSSIPLLSLYIIFVLISNLFGISLISLLLFEVFVPFSSLSFCIIESWPQEFAWNVTSKLFISSSTLSILSMTPIFFDTCYECQLALPSLPFLCFLKISISSPLTSGQVGTNYSK